MIGKVTSFNDSKGFGFIETDTRDSIFVHYTEIQGPGFKTLAEDQRVEFELYEDHKGLTAKNVRKL